ncbi:EpsG family protein [Flavobacterium foetidum]|uniref:EpsG family protein n=1 Tax=Flavobacterium foetidum TaxID=2026681 RepID=UPI00107506F1|nr:EpsG family protein [Flavobacterium foetidum]KAF2513538.1 EpsG family protein [Flavobacterium foetidum]
MGIYFGIFIFFGIFAFLEIWGAKKTAILPIFLFLSLFLYILSFIRWETGTDWITYEFFFNKITGWFGESEFEWGFARLNEFVKITFDNYSVLLFILGTILFSFQTKAIYNFSCYPLTSLWLLWCISLGNVFFVRQTVATVLMFYAIRFIQEKKLYYFCFFILLAMLFHRTSIVFIFAWWVYKAKISVSRMLLIIGLSVVFSFVVGIIIGKLGETLGGIFQQKVDVYFADSDATYGMEVSKEMLVIRAVLNKGFIFFVSLYMLKKIEFKNKEYRGFLNLYWFGMVLYFSTVSISIVLARLAAVYDLTLIILIAFILKYANNIYEKLFLFLCFTGYFVLKLYTTINLYYDFYVPYKTIF